MPLQLHELLLFLARLERERERAANKLMGFFLLINKVIYNSFSYALFSFLFPLVCNNFLILSLFFFFTMIRGKNFIL